MGGRGKGEGGRGKGVAGARRASRYSLRLVLLALTLYPSPFTLAPALAHDGKPHRLGDLIYTWGFDPLVVGGLALSGWLYARGVRRLWRGAGRGGGIRRWEVWAYAGGWLALFV